MPAPEVSAFGDGSHAPGASGLTVGGGGFGAFPGSVWIYENADLTGNADELTVSAWNDLEIGVDIPGSLNNAAGTRYLFVQREDLAWSNAFAFTLEAGATDRDVDAATQALTLTAQPAVVNRSRGVNATTQALSLVGQSASIARDRTVLGQAQAIAFTGHQASVGRGADRQVVAQTEALSFDEQAATVSRDRGVLATPQSLSLAGQAATIVRTRGVAASAAVLTLVGQPATVVRGVLVSIVGVRATVTAIRTEAEAQAA